MLSRRGLFISVCALGAGVIALAIYHAKTRTAESAGPAAPTIDHADPPAPPLIASVPKPSEPAAAGSGAPDAQPPEPAPQTAPARAPGPRQVFYRYNGVDAHYGHVAYVEPSRSMEPHFVEQLTCEVVYVAAGHGICLQAHRGVITTYAARLFDAGNFKTLAEFPLGGIPSRSRVSQDGKLAALTVFVSGHGYTALDFSTQTLLIDVPERRILVDVETFTVTRDGAPFKAADFNFWGVTFTADARDFYATLSTAGKHFLIRGNIATRSAVVVHENVECPSLSPDAKHIAYKKRLIIDNRITWQLHVLDLATGRETALAEKRSIDDQLEWLDNEHVLYSVPETPDDSTPSTNVWMAAADGSKEPTLYLRKAYSPAAVRD